MQRYLLFLLITVTFFCCDNPEMEPVKEVPKIDKTVFIASLVSGFKFWRFEELTIERPDSTTTVELRWDPAKVLPSDIFLDRVHTGHSFLSDGKFMFDAVDGGPFGNVPYGVSTISIWIPGSSTSYTGSWYWDEERETVAIKGPLWTFDEMIRAISKKESSPAVGYLDNTMQPKYKTLKQALEGASPDRIRIIFYEDESTATATKYIFTMRAAWVTKIVEVRARTESYEVLY